MSCEDDKLVILKVILKQGKTTLIIFKKRIQNILINYIGLKHFHFQQIFVKEFCFVQCKVNWHPVKVSGAAFVNHKHSYFEIIKKK